MSTGKRGIRKALVWGLALLFLLGMLPARAEAVSQS